MPKYHCTIEAKVEGKIFSNRISHIPFPVQIELPSELSIKHLAIMYFNCFTLLFTTLIPNWKRQHRNQIYVRMYNKMTFQMNLE